jgi:hypothetical protein
VIRRRKLHGDYAQAPILNAAGHEGINANGKQPDDHSTYSRISGHPRIVSQFCTPRLQRSGPYRNGSRIARNASQHTLTRGHDHDRHSRPNPVTPDQAGLPDGSPWSPAVPPVSGLPSRKAWPRPATPPTRGTSPGRSPRSRCPAAWSGYSHAGVDPRVTAMCIGGGQGIAAVFERIGA